LLLSCCEFWLFSDQLIGSGDRVSIVRAWSPSLDSDLDPSTGVEQVGLVCAWGTSEACVFRGTQLGTLIRESLFLRDGTT
jgi:hypothetical protein